MTIHNFYYFAGILLWLYVLLCISLALLICRRKFSARRKLRLKIDLFFQQPPVEETAKPVVKAIMEDDTLFLHFCRRYREGSCPTYAAQYTEFMRQVLRVKYRSLDQKDPIRTRMVRNTARQCGFPAPDPRADHSAARNDSPGAAKVLQRLS